MMLGKQPSAAVKRTLLKVIRRGGKEGDVFVFTPKVNIMR